VEGERGGLTVSTDNVQVQLRGGPLDRKVVTVPAEVARSGYIRMAPVNSPLLRASPPQGAPKLEGVLVYKVEHNPYKLVAYFHGDRKP
jgi:hypothetical protein